MKSETLLERDEKIRRMKEGPIDSTTGARGENALSHDFEVSVHGHVV